MASPLEDAFITAAGLLCVKLMVIHIWTVRSRTQSDVEAQVEDTTNPGFAIIAMIVKFLIGWGPRAKPVDMIERLAKNCAENEPFFMLVILALIQAPVGANHLGLSPEALAFLVNFYTVARFMHTFFLLMALQPFRTITWLISTGVLLVLSIAALDFKDGALGKIGIAVAGGLCALGCFQAVYTLVSRHIWPEAKEQPQGVQMI